MPGGAKRWVFTLNNYTDDETKVFTEAVDQGDWKVTYIIFGKEVGEANTPHLQGFICFSVRRTLVWLKRRLGNRVHLEVARGTSEEASEYCKKEDDFVEFGTLPVEARGSGNQFEKLKEWAKTLDKQPTEKEVADLWPALWCRYTRSVMHLVRMFAPDIKICEGELRPWQVRLHDLLLAEPEDDRKITFVVDHDGMSGKSWFCRYMISEVPAKVQVLGPAKRDDLAHVIDENKSIFLFNVPRGQMEYLNYGLLESLKDQMVLSPKYESRMKILSTKVHVVVFCNEDADMYRMTNDRYHFFDIA